MENLYNLEASVYINTDTSKLKTNDKKLEKLVLKSISTYILISIVLVIIACITKSLTIRNLSIAAMIVVFVSIFIIMAINLKQAANEIKSNTHHAYLSTLINFEHKKITLNIRLDNNAIIDIDLKSLFDSILYDNNKNCHANYYTSSDRVELKSYNVPLLINNNTATASVIISVKGHQLLDLEQYGFTFKLNDDSEPSDNIYLSN